MFSFDMTSSRCYHEYIIVRDDVSKDFKYIHQRERVNIIRPKDFSTFLNQGNFDALIIHGLRQQMIDLLPMIDKSIIVVWKAWGFDLYTNPHIYTPFIKINLYKPLTKNAIKESLFLRLREFHGYLHYLLNRKAIFNAISRVDLFSGVLRYEYDMMSRLDFFKAEEVYFPYISAFDEADKVDLDVEEVSLRKNILIGNSNDPSNNHLDAFEFLRFVNIGTRKIYCPLSYGGTDTYRSKVIAIGKQYWGDKFVPLLELLPKQEYMKIIDSCEIAVFNHERQQAIGNISHALWNGCSVYLSPTSINFKELSNIGFKVFDITQDLQSLLTLNESEKQRNRVLSENMGDKQAFINAVYDMYDKIESKKE